ncbi:ABC transporter ATP-binding protein [Ruania albidiflava]|uniref:ABC transporter ATP-binding protein n=1 Tax=Ruania albidiflava TaxID=366586 RepID=UPI0003FDE0FE|nr:ABC transporter ATP-binding protein [Ruania albidiflava]
MDGLQLRGGVVRYGSTTAVAGVDLRVRRGEVVALLGPSGCGKSSLLRAVAGLEPLAAGELTWDGADMTGVPVHRRGFGLMFQDGQLFPHRDVAGNVVYGLQMAGMPRAAQRERVAELLDLVGLADYATRPITALSGGEQQRVALARALAPRPRLLLLDEPLSALDRALREHLATELHDILRAAGTTALYVTHDHDEAFTVADRVALMRTGQIVQTGTPAELWAHPVDAEAARFLGYWVVQEAGRTLAISPHALTVAPLVEDDGAGHIDPDSHLLQGTVVSVGFARGRTTARVAIPGWGEQTATADGATCLDAGSPVRVQVEPRGVVEL